MKQLFDLLIPPAYAQVPIASAFPPAQAFPNVGSFVNVLVKNVLLIGGIVGFAMLIYVGYRYIESGGNEKATQQNQEAFTAIIIGLIIMFVAYFLVQIAETITGVQLLNPGI
ncbi:hypothetical protein C4579_01415 [Candidatus Microgenomates bacterium]|nr:MAG: hypothetical protein C4579_01415 [Candidatus Microgenomates bacterium]